MNPNPIESNKVEPNETELNETELDKTESGKTESQEEKSQKEVELDPTSKRPTKEDFKVKIEGYMRTKEAATHQYQSIIYELQDLSNGEGDQDIRDEYYKGWIDEDFKEMLKRLGEEE